jgi:hypothetical protein
VYPKWCGNGGKGKQTAKMRGGGDAQRQKHSVIIALQESKSKMEVTALRAVGCAVKCTQNRVFLFLPKLPRSHSICVCLAILTEPDDEFIHNLVCASCGSTTPSDI